MNIKKNSENDGHGRGAGLLAHWLRSVEQPAGPLLLEVQGQMDQALCERLLKTLHSRMVGNGRRVEWCGGQWSPTFQDALGAGLLALAQWRAGVDVEGAEHGAAAVVWRAMVASIDSDTWGDSPAGVAAVAELQAWLELENVGASPWEIRREWHLERLRHGHQQHKQARRLAMVEQVRDGLAAGRGRRAALADKVKQATVLMLSGMVADEAAAAAGFKASAGGRGGGGKVKPADRLAAALKRAGVAIVAKRGRWADDTDEFKAAARRGAAADLAVTFHGWPSLPDFVPAVPSAVIIPPLHPLARAASGLSLDASGESARRPASRRAVLASATAVASARRWRGVIRSRFHCPAAEVVKDAALPVAVPSVPVPDGARRSAKGWLSAVLSFGVGSGCWQRVVGSHFTVSPSGECHADGGGVLLNQSGVCLGFKAV
jgi:hypothetical protein